MPDIIKGMYINVHHQPTRCPNMCSVISVMPNTAVLFNPGLLVSGNFILSVYDRLCGMSSVLQLTFFGHVPIFWFLFGPQ